MVEAGRGLRSGLAGGRCGRNRQESQQKLFFFFFFRALWRFSFFALAITFRLTSHSLQEACSLLDASLDHRKLSLASPLSLPLLLLPQLSSDKRKAVMPPLASFPVEPVASFGGASAVAAGGNEGEEKRLEHSICVFASAPSAPCASRSGPCSPFEALFDVSETSDVSCDLAGATGAPGDGSCVTRARETFLESSEHSKTHDSPLVKLAFPFLIPSDTGFPSFAAPPVTTGGLWMAPPSCDDAAAMTDAVVPRAVPVFDDVIAEEEKEEEEQANKPSVVVVVAAAEPATTAAAAAPPPPPPSRPPRRQAALAAARVVSNAIGTTQPDA